MSSVAGTTRRPRLPVARPTIVSAQRESLNHRPTSANNAQAKPKSTKGSSVAIPASKIQKLGRPPDRTVVTGHIEKKTYQLRSKEVLNANLEFYRNKMRSKPGGHTIEEILKWEKNYDRLEKNHRYIQWLFPLPDSRGMNPQSQPLQDHEAETIRTTHQLKQRVLKAYKMMLDFYGMKLECTTTGQIGRSKNWEARYNHLDRSFHNFLRISRILKSLGCLGFERYQYPWLRFILEEAVVNKTLPHLDCGAVTHWINALNNDSERDEIKKYYKEIKHGGPINEVEMEWEMSEPESDENGDQ